MKRGALSSESVRRHVDGGYSMMTQPLTTSGNQINMLASHIACFQ